MSSEVQVLAGLTRNNCLTFSTKFFLQFKARGDLLLARQQASYSIIVSSFISLSLSHPHTHTHTHSNAPSLSLSYLFVPPLSLCHSIPL